MIKKMNTDKVEIIDYEKKALIDEALRIRAEACEILGPEVVSSLYSIVTGKKL